MTAFTRGAFVALTLLSVVVFATEVGVVSFEFLAHQTSIAFGGALLASAGAFAAEVYAAATGSNRRRAAIAGVWCATSLGLLLILLQSQSSLAGLSVGLQMFTSLWTVHWILVSLVATAGVCWVFEPQSAIRSYWGALMGCLLAAPVTCPHLLLLHRAFPLT